MSACLLQKKKTQKHAMVHQGPPLSIETRFILSVTVLSDSKIYIFFLFFRKKNVFKT